MNEFEKDWDIVLFERNSDDGQYIKITIDEATQQRVVIEANADLISEDEFESVLQLITDSGASRFVICTGYHGCGIKFARQLQSNGSVVISTVPGASLDGLDNNKVVLIESDDPMIEMPELLKKASILFDVDPYSGEKDEDKRNGNTPQIYADESTYF